MTGWGITNYTWDQYGQVLTKTSPRGVTTTNTYNYSSFTLGELTQTQDSYISGGTTYYKTATNYTYDDSDGYDDPIGNFHPCGLLTSISSPTPGVSGGGGSQVTKTLSYDVTGQGAKPMGNLGLGNPVSITMPGNNAVPSITTTLNYTTDGTYSQSAAISEALTLTDNLGNVTHMRYDSRSNAVSITDALGNVTNMTYTLTNQPLESIYPATGQTGVGNSMHINSYLYTASATDPTEEYGPLNAETDYDESSTLVKQVDHTYGDEGETLATSGGAEPKILTYDALYRILSIADGNNNETVYSYNTVGYLFRVNYTGSGGATSGSDTIQYTGFDGYGNVTQRIDGRGIITNYSYNDPERNLTGKEYPASPSLNVSYAYDGFGRTISMSDGTGLTNYSYDDNNKLINTVTTYTGVPAQAIGYSYYSNGSESTLTTPAGNFNYTYDGDGRMSSLTNPNSETSSWIYRDNDSLSTQTLANGVVTSYTYNARGFITDLTNATSGGTTLSEFGSTMYNGVGDQTSVIASVPALTADSGSTSYSYDSIGTGGTRSQITGESSTRAGGYSETNAYDNAENLTTLRSSSSASFNSDNQNSALGYSYDGSGNPTTYSAHTLSFDSEDRMTTFGSALIATYRGDNLRASKTNSTTTIYYLYDGTIPVVEFNSSGAVVAVNTFGTNGLLSRYSGSGSTFYTFDQQGNPAQLLDSSANILNTNVFDSFGLRTSSGSSNDPYSGFESQYGYYTDSETGLALCTYRYYDPANGRFINRDPISYNGGINLYGYVHNNPVGVHDYLGLNPNGGDPKPPGCGDDPNNPCWVNTGSTLGGGLGAWGGAIGGAEGGAILGTAVGGPVGTVVGGVIGGIVGGIAGGFGGSLLGGFTGGILEPKTDGWSGDPVYVQYMNCSSWWIQNEINSNLPYAGMGGGLGGVLNGIKNGAPVPE